MLAILVGKPGDDIRVQAFSLMAASPFTPARCIFPLFL